MGVDTVHIVGTPRQVDLESTEPNHAIRLDICDTEGELPSPAWGRFAVVKEATGGGPQGPRHYLYVATGDIWKRAELEPVDD